MPWDSEIENSTLARAKADGSANEELPLKIGVFWTDGAVGPQPPIGRGLRIVHDLLKSVGHKLAFLKADGAHDVHQQLNLSGEPLVPPLRNSFQLHDPIPLLEYQDLTIQGKTYNDAYSDYWNSTAGDDGMFFHSRSFFVRVLTVLLRSNGRRSNYASGTSRSGDPGEVLSYVAAVIPVTKADKLIDKFDHDYRPLNEDDRKNWQAYDPEIYDGAPVGLQIVARKHEEEKVWAIAKIVDAALTTRGARAL
ncbi:MAG: hypothetical protein Q9164_004847 [Protoblastenia rupestris]